MYSGSRDLKYYKRLKIFKNSTATVKFDPETMQAYSYDNWQFVARIGGKVVFNSYRYSSTTSAHQGAVRRLLQKLEIAIDIEVEAPHGLGRLEDAIHSTYRRAEDFKKQIPAARSRKECLIWQYHTLLRQARDLEALHEIS